MWLEQLTPLAEDPVTLREQFALFLVSPLPGERPESEDDELRESLGLRRAG